LTNSEEILTLKEVSIYQSNRLILNNINLNVSKGEFIYLVGKTGSGKSSLFETLYADIPLKKGSAEIVGFNLSKIQEKEIPMLRRNLGIVFQKLQLLHDRTVNENLLFVMKATGWKDKEKINNRIQEVLNDVKMSSKGKKMPYELSGGEQQRISIARALVNNPSLILADEPTRNLDPEASEEIMCLLRKICSQGKSVIMICHDKYLMNQFPSKIIYCYNQTISSDPPLNSH
tara:strand:+ start:2940 stop:3632 length:693 start_codon:yes stop_codon:yes gene_type:complete